MVYSPSMHECQSTGLGGHLDASTPGDC